MFFDTDINVGYETWHLRIAPLDAFGSPIVTITDAKDHQHFQGTEEDAFRKLVTTIARQHYDSLAKVDKVPETPRVQQRSTQDLENESSFNRISHSPPEKTESSASTQPKQGGSHARPQSSKK